MKRTLACYALALGIGFAAGAVTARPGPTVRSAAPVDAPETIEVFRPEWSGLPEVNETVRIVGGPDAVTRRPPWTVRLRYGERVVQLTGEGLNRPPAP